MAKLKNFAIQHNDFIISLVIYLIAMSVSVYWIINGALSDDGKALYYLYNSYIDMLNNGGFHLINTGLSSSCLTTTLFPAIVQNLLHTDPLLTYCTIPYIFYSFIPVSSYLISRRYLNIRYSVIVAVLILVSFTTLQATIMDKMGISLGAMSVSILALLNKDFVLAGFFGVIVVLSHYAVGFIYLGIVAVAVLATIISLYNHRKNNGDTF